MAVRTRISGSDGVAREDDVTSCSNRICYPGVSTCISITGVSGLGMVCTHITAFTPDDEVDEIFQLMRSGGAAAAETYYVVGAIRPFKQRAAASINTRKKIRDVIRSRLSEGATVRFADTTDHGGVHLLGIRTAGGPAGAGQASFSWIDEHAEVVQGWDYPDFGGTTPIPAGAFVER